MWYLLLSHALNMYNIVPLEIIMNLCVESCASTSHAHCVMHWFRTQDLLSGHKVAMEGHNNAVTDMELSQYTQWSNHHVYQYVEPYLS